MKNHPKNTDFYVAHGNCVCHVDITVVRKDGNS